MEGLKYIATLITIFIAVYSVAKEHTKLSKWSISKTGIFLIALIIISSSIYLYIDIAAGRENEKDKKFLNNNIENLKTKNTELSGKVEDLIEDNFKLSREITKNVLGEGFAVFGLMGENENNRYYGTLKSNSAYPIYDISILVTDFDKAINCKHIKNENEFIFDQECFFKNTFSENINNLAPRMSSFPKFNLETELKRKNIEIKFISRNSNILQQSVFDLKKGHCEQSYRIYKIENNNLELLKEVNPLNLPKSYWSKNFFPAQNRKIGIVSSTTLIRPPAVKSKDVH